MISTIARNLTATVCDDDQRHVMMTIFRAVLDNKFGTDHETLHHASEEAAVGVQQRRLCAWLNSLGYHTSTSIVVISDRLIRSIIRIAW